MFKGLRSAFQQSKDVWGFAGYWTEVVAEYGKLTGWNLEKTAKASSGARELDEFCRKAMNMGLSAKACAVVISAEGFHDPGVLDELVKATEPALPEPRQFSATTNLLQAAQDAARFVRWAALRG